MAAIPVDIPMCKWTLVASNILQIRVKVISENPSKYYYIVVPAGDPEPANSPIEGTLLKGSEIDIHYRGRIDFYVAAFDFPGKISIDDDINFTDVYVQDQTTQVVDVYAFIPDGSFDVAVPAVIDENEFTAVDASGMTIGDIVCFQEGTRFFQAIILNIIVNQVYIDTPFEYAFSTSGGCSYGDKNLNVDGSITPKYARIGPGLLDDGVSWHIVRCTFTITDQTAMDDNKFGGLTALPRGIVLRVKNGIYKNIFNVKTNGQFRARNYDAEYTDKAPAGYYGFSSRRTFGGRHKNGVVLKLNAVTNDEAQLIIQDDLTLLDTFELIIQGHEVE